MTPVGAAFAGVHANKTMLEGALELTGTAETFVDQAPPAVTPTPLAPLGKEVAAPGTFDIILPVHINYATLRRKILDAIAAAPKGETTIRDVEIYPSAGKIVVGLRIAKSSDSDANAGEWLYLSAVPQVDADAQTLRLPDLTVAGVAVSDIAHLPGGDALLASLRQQIDASYRAAYRQLLDSANARLTRPLSDGFRLEGHLNSAKVEKILLLAEGLNVALRASGELKILYGL
jgi:hypothetical protein